MGSGQCTIILPGKNSLQDLSRDNLDAPDNPFSPKHLTNLKYPKHHLFKLFKPPSRMSLSLFLAIAASAMLPVTELRATIPFFIKFHPELPIWFIFTGAVIGNMVPNFFLLWFLPRITTWLHDHAAPRINYFVLWLHDVIVKGKRISLIYFLIIFLTGGGLATLHFFNVQYYLWYWSIAIGIPLWSYIMFKTANKAYKAALEEKSIIHWFYSKVQKEHSQKFYRWGSLALIAIVGIPVPGTGSWTGSVLAFLFNIPFWKALGLIFIGILIAGGIVTGLSTGIINGLGII
jgi:uncharacterized membrane protein